MEKKYLEQLFDTFNKSDFYNYNANLKQFYKQYEKNKNISLLNYFLEFATRNKEFNNNLSERDIYINKLCETLKMQISSMDSVEQVKPNFLELINNTIETSGHLVYEDPAEAPTEYDLAFRDNGLVAIMSEIKQEVSTNGRIMPKATPNKEFNDRNRLLDRYRNTSIVLETIHLDPRYEELYNKINRIYYINLAEVSPNMPNYHSHKISFFDHKEEIVLESSNLVGINDKARFIKADPIVLNIDIVKYLLEQPPKQFYICTGNKFVYGGNADQGIKNAESTLFINTTYSLNLNKVVKAYPLSVNYAFYIPNVLIIKDGNDNSLEIQKWQQCQVLNAPCLRKPKTDIVDQLDNEFDRRLHSPTVQISAKDILELTVNIRKSLEFAMFRGSRSVIVDDKAVLDNFLPTYLVANIYKQILPQLKVNVVFCIADKTVYDIFKSIL